MPSPALHWFRTDLRLSDNPALTEAARAGRPMVGLFVLDEDSAGLRPLGGAARWWLARSLRALATDLAARGVPLVLRRGRAGEVVPAVMAELQAEALTFNARPGAAEHAIDTRVAEVVRAHGAEVKVFNAHLLHPPGTVTTQAGTLPRTFSAFQRAAFKERRLREPLPIPAPLTGWAGEIKGDALEEWGLEPAKPDWAGGLRGAWTCGEAAAQARLNAFVSDGLKGYADGRDVPSAEHVSRLSPALRFGEISPRQVRAVARHAAELGAVSVRDADKFESELYWREFAHHLLAAEPDMAHRNLQAAFDDFPWRDGLEDLVAWQKGLTGYPIVDAGMRQLWQTGWMHNRVRMVVASFLSKHLLIHWRHGEEWFWDTLVDACPANNPASWQWVAGSGVDAAPYFRVFNPVLQGEKFDPDGTYVRTYVPELARLPAAVLHKPWTADRATLERAGVKLGLTYPHPMVDHTAARDRALAAFERIKRGSS